MKKFVYYSLLVTTLMASCHLRIFAQCSINAPSIVCAGDPVNITSNCNNTYNSYRVEWFINSNLATDATDLGYTFPSAGTYEIGLRYYTIDFNGDAGSPTDLSLDLTVNAAAPIVPISGTTGICESGDVALSGDLAGVQGQLGLLNWTSSPAGYTGTTASVTFTNVTKTTTFFLEYTTPVGCSSSYAFQIPVYKTTRQPQLDATVYYHKRYLTTAFYNSSGPTTPGDGFAYWQTAATGTDLSNQVQASYLVTQEADYYIRNNVGTCWTTASPSVHASFSYTPPLATIVEVKKLGYNDISFINTDKNHILSFATYYWVSDTSANPTILSAYNSGTSITGNRIIGDGIYYLKGKDNGSGTWGPTLTLTEVLRNDDELNWVATTTYDGTFNTDGSEKIAGASKSYFDQTGKALQSQSLNVSTNQVLASHAAIKDGLGREAVAALSAPTNSSAFRYKHFFVTDALGDAFTYFDLGPAQNVELGQTTPGTVGWYYSANNTLETNVPQSKFAYSRQSYYPDGTSGVMMSAGASDKLKIGSGHEVLTGSFPVANELDYYLQLRNNVISGSPSTLAGNAVQTVVKDENGRYAVSIADKSGKTVLTARKGASTDNVIQIQNTVIAQVTDATLPNYKPQVYFYILDPQPVTITGSGTYVVKELTSDITFGIPANNGNWPAGFYRILLSSGQIQLSYTNYFVDVACQFYDHAGRLVSSISPNGFKSIVSGANLSAAYTAADKTTYTYNHRGWLLNMTEPDAGTTQYLYRKDGSIRYSQNAKQKNNTNGERFSYTLYDGLSRPIESGEYKGTAYSFGTTALKNTLDYDVQVSLPSADVVDWVKTHYDYADANFATQTSLTTTAFPQNYVRNAVSWTENANIKTWYSYDERGRVTWMIQKPLALGNRAFAVEYTYDFLGNVTLVKQTAYLSGGLLTTFYHHYEYDADKRLSKAYTSTDGTNKTLHAAYSYYLHGPLKRIELAGNLQGIDFIYNIHGWLESINHPDKSKDPGHDGDASIAGNPHAGFRTDVFGLLLDYYDSEFTNLFPQASLDGMKSIERFHRFPAGIRNVALVASESFYPQRPASFFDQPQDDSFFKNFSVENKTYKELVSRLKRDSNGTTQN